MAYAVNAEEIQVQGVVDQWKPMVVFAKPGDSVKFVSMTGHNSESLDGMIPEGAQPWRSKLGEEGFTVKLEKEGAYIYKCTPHASLGMIGAIIVGDKTPVNLAAIDAALPNIKAARNMVARALKKMKEALAAKGM